MKNKEFGSDFHTYTCNEIMDYKATDFFPKETHFTFSGRVALYAILQNGIDNETWKRLYVPSYYCHEVYDFISNLDIELIMYEFLPNQEKINNPTIINDSSSVVLVVDYFGINKLSLDELDRVVVIEDLTHNLTNLMISSADFTFGSLRKVLPVGVGGFMFSNKGFALPLLPSTVFAGEVAYKKTVGMFLKKKYLEGKVNVEKSKFRTLLMTAESDFENLNTISSIPNETKLDLCSIDIKSVILAKKENISYAKSLLAYSSDYSLINSILDTDFALILFFENSFKRDELKAFLIENNIYPIILWPNQKGLNKDYQDKILFIHMDYRYSIEDIKYIVNKINNFFGYV